ncbi:MAG: hypothetical protein MK085_05380 [Phycisphaerales bacterium]|nr:hypothetical protein [Phycisphaerales bacterium]
MKFDLHEGVDLDRGSPLLQQGWVGTGEIQDLCDWTMDITPAVGGTTSAQIRGMRRCDLQGEGLSWRSVVVPGARSMSSEKFEAASCEACRLLLEGLDPTRLARVWNFVPGINDLVGDMRDRYMVFNAGRFSAYRREFGLQDFPVASGVGHSGDDLVLHLLHGGEMITPIANQRQVPPEQYSERYGSLPPAFCRAALVRISDSMPTWFLASGTASVVGEESAHIGDLDGQLRETVANLTELVEEASRRCRRDIVFDETVQWLVYVPKPSDVNHVREGLAGALSTSQDQIQVRVQALCRPELLLEVEFGMPLSADMESTG